MSKRTAPDADPTRRGWRARRRRTGFVAAATFIGLCEALTVSPWIDWDVLPDAVSVPIALVGFATFVVLVGPFGNAAAAVGLFLIAHLRWRWPAWRCLAVSTPFICATCQLVPKPW